MALLQRLVVQFSDSVNIKPLRRTNLLCEKFYSVYPSRYIKPVFTKEGQREVEATGEIKVLEHLPIKPAYSNETSSEFYDALVTKFINHLTKQGKKALARSLMDRTFENIKRIQLERYNNATPEEQSNIELDPKIILHKAVENSTPVLELTKIRKGGASYPVPVPLNENRSQFLAIKWLILAGKEKKLEVHLPDRLAYELIDASNNQGRVIRKKQELYRQCEANRSYAHFRWI